MDSDVEALRERVRRRASGSAAPAAAAEADAGLGEEAAREGLRRRERSAHEKRCQMSLRTIICILTRCRRTNASAISDSHLEYIPWYSSASILRKRARKAG